MKKDIKQFLEEELKKEEIATMKEVAEDIEVQGLTVPDELGEALFAQIDAYEKSLESKKAEEISRLTEEEKELIHLGKVYRRKKKFTKYWVLAAVLVLVLAVGMTSMGGPKKIVKMFVETIQGKGTEIEVDTDDGSISDEGVIKEEEAYRQIKEKWNVEPVRLQYLPMNVIFKESSLDESLQMARLHYKEDNKIKIVYYIMPNYLTGSFSADIKDPVLKTYTKEISGVEVDIKQYQVQENQKTRWFVKFKYKDVQYFMWIVDEEQDEIDKIIENMYFL